MQKLRADLLVYGAREWSWKKFVSLVLRDPGFRAVAIFRLQEAASLRQAVFVADLVRQVNCIISGADFVTGATIGPGLLIRHPSGIVVGAGARIGSYATIMQGVTIGEIMSPRRSREHSYPRVENRVLLGAHCVLLGPITVGEGAVVGANAVVLDNVPSKGLAVGAPAVSRSGG